jgi:hypothetical protein
VTLPGTWSEFWDHVRACVSEGLCPRCQGALEPAPYHPLRLERAYGKDGVLEGAQIVGWCRACRLYWNGGPKGAGSSSGYLIEPVRNNYQKAMGYPIS